VQGIFKWQDDKTEPETPNTESRQRNKGTNS